MDDNNCADRSQVSYCTISDEQAGQRIDNFLHRILKGVPKSKIYRILRKGEVRVNKRRVKAPYKLCEGDLVRIPPIDMVQPIESAVVSYGLEQLLNKSVVYEDDRLLVVNKPSGLAVHGGSGVKQGLIEALRVIRPDNRYLELVHRLDRDTSGCIMVAKKRSMLRYLHQQLREGRVEKRYLALVYGRWPKRREVVNAPLLKNILKSGERMVNVDEQGKKSLTRFAVLERFRQATLVEAQPVTGRTHQIRVHALHAGCPLLGDTKYGNQQANATAKGYGLSRLFLHAVGVRIPESDTHPLIDVAAELGDELQRVLQAMRADTMTGDAESD